jgi:hypothetical protein
MERVGFERFPFRNYHIDLDIACDLEKLAEVVGSNLTQSIFINLVKYNIQFSLILILLILPVTKTVVNPCLRIRDEFN